MNYPLISEYVESIKLAEDNFAELTNLRPVLGEDGTPVMSSGNFAVVFKMQDTQTGKFHAVRCFHREQAGRTESYKLIEAELNKVASPYVVSFRYMERELFVDSKQTTETEFPVLLMDWVEGVTLDKYLREHIVDKRALDMLTYHFSQLAVWLMPQPFAHGDLKPDNILVRPDGTPVLVDYDGMFVPAMQGQQARELGSPDFRHPLRTEDDFGERMDDFSLISILLSLKLTALHPEYLAEYGASDRLLFSANDYADIANCQLLKAVFPSADPELNRLASLFLLCHSTKNLANVSFVLLGVEKPKELSTKVTDEDLENAWEDEFGVKYSQDRKRLLECTNKDLKKYAILKNTKVICNNAFMLGAIEKIVLPDSVTTIGDYAFYGCISLKKITIPDLIITIGSRAFKWCKSIKEIIIPQSVNNISENPFSGCICNIMCNSIHFMFENGILYTARKDKIVSCTTDDETITIPDSVTTIGNGAFEECLSLREIIIPNSVTTIGKGAFWKCTSLEKITIPNSVTAISDSAFWKCTSLEKITIPNSVTAISDSAFWECTSLEKITIPDSVTTISDNAFVSCTSIKEITIPNSVTIIGNHAFFGCKSLEKIIIPDSVTAIGINAFWECTSLEKIIIPNSVTTIGDYAFGECASLKYIIIPDSVTAIGDDAFFACLSLENIIIPHNAREKFEELLPYYKDKLWGLL